MTQPVSYVPAVGFQAEETAAVAGRSTVRTSALDAELQAVSLTLSQILTNLAVIQRDDTGLRDLVVTTESLSANVKALFAGGINPRGAWLTATAYAVKDVVETLSPLISYICVIAHTSGTFATDRTAGKWMVLGSEPGLGTFTNIVLSTGGITLGTNNTQDLAATANRFRSGYFGTTVFAATSVVTPLVGTDTAVDFTLKTNATSRWFLSDSNTGALVPSVDNATAVGNPSFRVSKVFTPIIDSGTAGSVSIRTNNGTTAAKAIHLASAVNYVGFTPNAAGSPPILSAFGSDTNISLAITAAGTGGINFSTGTSNADSTAGAVQQFQILHTASATRNITVTGSNGGNPTIGVTGGNLAITPALVLTSTLNFSTAACKIIPGATSITVRNNADTFDNLSITDAGDVRVPRGSLLVGHSSTQGVKSRNFLGTQDKVLIFLDTANATSDCVFVGVNPAGGAGGTNTAGVIMQARSGAGAPTTSDLAAGQWMLWRDTSGATTKVYYNNAGAIQSVALT